MTREEYQKKYGQAPTLHSDIPVPQQKTSLGQKILNTGSDISNFLGFKGVSDEYGATIARANAPEEQKKLVDFPKMKQVVGSAIQGAANFIPGAGEGLNLAAKIGLGAATGYAVDMGSKLQNKDQTVGQALVPGAATAIGGGLPIVGAAIVRPATRIIGRLVKGLASGTSGVASDTIDKIIDNPKYAQEASNRLEKSGNSAVLKENAQQIVQGISNLKQQARKSFGEGLDQLSKEDINPTTFRQQTQGFLDKYGVSSEGDKRILSGVEFDEPKNIQKASDLIDKLHTTELDGKSLRKLADDIDSAKYKTATSDERLSFNAFLKDMSSSLKEGISASTGKLSEINKNFSQDMQLAESAENIFGKVNFKNLPEVVKASQKLEGLFNQKGIAPDVVDSFLSRIGINPEEFKTGEAVRQITNKSETANSVGTGLGEITRAATSAVITPKIVRDLSIFTGASKNTLLPFLRELKPAARAILLNALATGNAQSEQQMPIQ